MKYAKLDSGKLIINPGILIKDKRLILKPTAEQMAEAGYLPVVETEAPEIKDGYIRRSRWVQTDSAIEKKWTVLPDMRPLSQSEVNRRVIAQQINSLAVDDNTALRMRKYYPEWASGESYTVGHKVQYDGKLWRTRQAHTAQIGWEPENAASLWEQVNETHGGTLEDPIPYDGNMALENGRYYVQADIIYLCNRDTGNPVYHALSELVGLYVEEV